MKKVLLISFLILTTLMVHSQNQDGAWTLDKIEVTLTADGQSDKKVYTPKDTYKTSAVSIERLEFTSGNNLSVLFKGWKEAESFPYSISGNTLTWNHPTRLYKYNMRYNNGVLELSDEGRYAIDGKIYQYRYVHYLKKNNTHTR